MTPEQQKAIAIASARARLAAKASAPVDKPVDKPELSGVDYARGLAQTVSKGSLSGWGDEVVGAGRAVLDYAMPGVTGEGSQSFGERYRMYRDDERKSQKQFADENKRVATATEIVGAFGSPLNKAKLLTKGAAGASKAAQLIARGGAEGALYGAGEADEVENIKQGALDAAQTGAVGTAVISGAGGALGKALSNNRVKEALWTTLPDGSKVFKPLNLADAEGRLGKTYRDFIGVAWGGENVGKQESKYLQHALARTLKDTPTESAVEQAKRLIPEEVGTKNSLRDVTQAITDQRLLEKSRLTNKLLADKGVADLATDQRLAGIASDTVNTIATKEADVAGNVVRLRQEAAKRAVPVENITVLDGTDLTNPQQVAGRLEQFWNKDAFRMVKDKPAFTIGDSVHRTLQEAMDADAALKGAIENKIGPIEKLPEVIDGDTLMEIRNRFARGANKASGLDRYGQRLVANELDDVITSQLDDDAAAAFGNQKEVYKNWLSFRDATSRAYEKQGGFFDSAQLRSSSKKYGKGYTGEVPFEDISQPALASEAGLRDVTQSIKTGEKVATAAEKSALKQTKLKLSQSTAHKLNRSKQRERAAKRFVESESRGATAENPSVGNKAVATALLGAPIGMVTGHAATLPIGYGVAKLASKPSVQTYLAGQAKWQTDLAKALREGGTDIYGRSLNRAVIGQQTD